jgi:fumarate hydratase class II
MPSRTHSGKFGQIYVIFRVDLDPEGTIVHPSRMTEKSTRTELDTFGPIEVPSDRLWGAQTQRSLQNFAISGERMPAQLLRALAVVKKAAALVNMDLKAVDAPIGNAIVAAAEEVIAGMHDAEFPLVVWQTGSGTQSNMA